MPFLSASANGEGIVVTGVNSAAAIVVDDSPIELDADGDEMQINNQSYSVQAVNLSDSDIVLTLEWGGADPNNLIKQTIVANSGVTPVISGLTLMEPASIKAFASAADAVVIYGMKQRTN